MRRQFRQLTVIVSTAVIALGYSPRPAQAYAECGFCFEVCHGGDPIAQCTSACGIQAYEYHCHPGIPSYNGCGYDEFFVHCYGSET
jgi:hypothetical protein